MALFASNNNLANYSLSHIFCLDEYDVFAHVQYNLVCDVYGKSWSPKHSFSLPAL
jgi:hypothetical protein